MTRSPQTTQKRPGAPVRRRENPVFPDRVGPWQLVEPLCVGAVTATFLARPANAAGRTCQYVVKLLHGESAANSQCCQLLHREATIGRKVCHPHLISILDANTQTPPYYVVMPRLEGQTLRAILDRRARLRISVASWFARQTAEALSALHAEGWLHLDVKPTNIFVAPDGHVTLLDLGFARPKDEEGSAADRPIVGTFNYIAPETIISTAGSDVRSDIYSLGATLYEMVGGQPPFAAQTLSELAGKHRQERPPCIRQWIPELPRTAAGVIHRMLAKQPLRRPHSADEVVRRLVALEIETFVDRCVA
jgi:serine/threonine-protein kinase